MAYSISNINVVGVCGHLVDTAGILGCGRHHGILPITFRWIVLRGLEPQNQHLMVCSCGRGPDGSCWHATFVFWVYCTVWAPSWVHKAGLWPVSWDSSLPFQTFRPRGSQLSRCWMLLILLQIFRPSSHRINPSWCVAAAMDLINSCCWHDY